MENDRKLRGLAIVAICVAVVCVSVAYAALASTLKITGGATVTVDDSWKVIFNNVSDITKSNLVTNVTDPTTTNNTAMTWKATFGAPKATYQFKATIENQGSIPAKLSLDNFAVAEGQERPQTFIACRGVEDDSICNNFNYTVTYNSASIDNANGIVLEGAGNATTAKMQIVVTVTFDEEGNLSESQLTALNNKAATFTLNLPFAQATDTDVTDAKDANKFVASN